VTDPQKSQLNIYLPKELHQRVKAAAGRNGLTLEKYLNRVIRNAVDSDAQAQASPTWLDAWERFLAKTLKKQ
jgi:hypothetical protein